MIISEKHYQEVYHDVEDISSVETTLNKKIAEMKKTNEKLVETINILIERPPVTLAPQPINIGDFRISRYLRYTRYNSRGSMNFDRFIDFCEYDTDRYEKKLSDDGRRYIVPLVPIMRGFKSNQRVIVKFPMNFSLTTYEMSDYRPSIESRSYFYEKGQFESGVLVFFSKPPSTEYRNEGHHSGMTSYIAFWDKVKDLIKTNIPKALNEADKYMADVNALNMKVQEILFPLYAKRDLFSLE